MNCPYCGRALAEDARFCDACGKPLKQTEEKKPRKKATPEARKNRRRFLHFLRGMVAGLLLANLVVAIANSDLGKLARSAHKVKRNVLRKLHELRE